MGNVRQKVALKNARFFAPIGYYEEEQCLGNEFFVTIEVGFPFVNTETENLNNTVNYVELYELVKRIFTPKRQLLESAAADILTVLQQDYPFADEIYVSIVKQHPPFGGDMAQSEVVLTYRADS